MLKRFRRVDRDAQVGPVVEALRVPGVEGPQLVDDPTIVSARGVAARGVWAEGLEPRGSDVTETFGFPDPLVQQEIDVFEEKLAALGVADCARRVAARDGGSLLEDPWIPERAPSHEHARNTAVQELLDELRRLDAIAAAEDRDSDA